MVHRTKILVQESVNENLGLQGEIMWVEAGILLHSVLYFTKHKDNYTIVNLDGVDVVINESIDQFEKAFETE